MPASPLKTPFPWFGGKSQAASLIWQALGDVENYVEPFFGSGAVLFNRPHAPRIETVNDKDGFVCNVWRALAADPTLVAHYADWPVNECDLHARHLWLKDHRQTLTRRLEGDPDYYDAKIAGWWLWGVNCWIGSGWCSDAAHGPWRALEDEEGHRQLVQLGNGGQGIPRKRVQLGTAGRGIHRQRVQLGTAGQGDEGLLAWCVALQERLRRVRICCGDWQRVLGPSPTIYLGLTGVVLDPPYSAEEGRTRGLYAIDDDTVAHAVRAWCVEHGRDPCLRIVLCGYGDVHDALLLQGWSTGHWVAKGGYSNQNRDGDNPNKWRETLWLSPACQPLASGKQLSLFHEEPYDFPCIPSDSLLEL